MTEETLWRHFSKFIRLRDRITGTDYCKCASCPKQLPWKEMDAGHFISRRHKATKYHEKNVLSQCPHCNRFNQGKQYEMGMEVDRRFGQGTADLILAKSKQTYKLHRFEIDQLGEHYRSECKRLTAI